MIVLDTTILVYAVGSDHALARPCRDLVSAIGEGDVQATTTLEVLQEFLHVRARRRGRREAAELTDRFATLLGPALQLQETDLTDGLQLFLLHDQLGAFDAVLAAATVRVGSPIVSADHAFAEIPELRHLDPRGPDFLAQAAEA